MSALPATVEAPVETETIYGGRTTTWTAQGVVWIDLDGRVPRDADGADRPPERLETALGRARTHPALDAGVRLQTGDGPPWTVRAVRPDPRPGRLLLDLERLL